MAYVVTNNPWTSQFSVGVGTENPEAFGALAVRRSVSINSKNVSFSTSDAALSTFDIRHLSSVVDLSSQNSNLTFSTSSTSSDGIERMRISTDGNINFGTTTSPTFKAFNLLNDANTAGNLLGMSRNAGQLLTNASAGDFIIGVSTGKNVLFGNTQTGTTEYMRISSTGLVGIGTSSPSSLLHLAGGGTGTRGALRISEAGLTNYWELGRDNTVSGDFTINSNATERMRITTTGNVGIGTSTPGTYKLNVNGTFYSAGSSLEYKKDIKTFDADTNKILELRPVTYQYKDEYKHLGKELKSGTQIGLIAEEASEVFPELAILKEDEDGVTRVRNVDYEKLSILLLSEVQKLRKELNALYKA